MNAEEKWFVCSKSEIVAHIVYTMTICDSELVLGHAKPVRGTSGVLCFGHGQPSISSLHLTSL